MVQYGRPVLHMAQVRLLLYPLSLDIVDFIDVVADKAESYWALAEDEAMGRSEVTGRTTPAASDDCTSESSISGCHQSVTSKDLSGDASEGLSPSSCN